MNSNTQPSTKNSTNSSDSIDNGTIREYEGKICVFIDGYWIRYYAPPPNTMEEKRQLILSLT